MYTEFFNLTHAPFRRTAFPASLFLDENRSRVLSVLRRAIREQGTAALLIGEPDTGKSTLLNALLEEPGPLSPICLLNTLLSAQDFRAAVFQAAFKKRFLPQDRNSFLQNFLIYLQRRSDEGFPCLLIIDEAQDLSTHVLQELGSFLQLKHHGNNLLSVLLSGHPHLREKLESPECHEFCRHIRCCCELLPLNGVNSRQYISGNLKSAGAESTIFSKRAMKDIYRYSRGYPGMINTLADRAMVLAFLKRRERIDSRLVEEAYDNMAWVKPANAAKSRIVLKVSATVFAFAAILLVWYHPLGQISKGPDDIRYPILPAPPSLVEEVRSDEAGDVALHQPADESGTYLFPSIAEEESTGSLKKELSPAPIILEACICRSVVNREPIGAAEFFEAAVGRVFCFTRISGDGIDSVIHVWYYGNSETARVRLPVKSANWRTFSSKGISEGQVGEWHVDVTDPDGNILERLYFQVR